MVEATTSVDSFDLKRAEKEETVAPSSLDSKPTVAAVKGGHGAPPHGDKVEGEEEIRYENSPSHCPPDAADRRLEATQGPEAIQEPEVTDTPTTSVVVRAGPLPQLPREQLGTNRGSKHATAALGCHPCDDKRPLTPEDCPVQPLTASKPESLALSNAGSVSVCSEGEAAKERGLLDPCPKEILPAKRIELETVVTGAFTLVQTQGRPLLQDKSATASSPSLCTNTSDKQQVNEADDVAMAATTRSVPGSRKPHPHTRPTKLLLGTPPSHELSSDDDDGEVEGRFVSSEEERTPEGGRREFVGHPYKSHLINNGEVVVPPEIFPTPPDMVTGFEYPMEPYRRQFSDNNRHHHTLSHRQGGFADAQALQRTNSEPLGGSQAESYAYIDNNGRKVPIKNQQGFSTP